MQSVFYPVAYLDECLTGVELFPPMCMMTELDTSSYMLSLELSNERTKSENEEPDSLINSNLDTHHDEVEVNYE